MFRIYLIAAVALGAFATPASAQPAEVSVKVADGELDTRAGRARLRQRVAAAIEQLCGSYAAIEPYQWPDIDKCWKSAWREANRQIAHLRGREPVKLGER